MIKGALHYSMKGRAYDGRDRTRFSSNGENMLASAQGLHREYTRDKLAGQSRQ
jgi:hypothetical protein